MSRREAAALIHALLDCDPDGAVDFLTNHADSFVEVAELLEVEPS